jgi:plasmid stabilization system protein ParE
VTVRFRLEAAEDVMSARLWYDQSRAGLGDEFVVALEQVVQFITDHPDAFPEIAARTRRALLQRFPYALYYRVAGDVIDVIACLHTRRSSDRWLRRV